MSRDLPLSTIARDYVCRLCGATLVIRPNLETGRPRVYCTLNPIHFSWIKKTAIERWTFERGTKNWSILHDRALIEAIPGWPQPECLPLEQCYEELFG